MYQNVKMLTTLSENIAVTELLLLANGTSALQVHGGSGLASSGQFALSCPVPVSNTKDLRVSGSSTKQSNI